MKSLLARMYVETASGRVAFAVGILMLCIPFAHFVGGPPPLTELQVVDGIVIQTEVINGIKGSQDVVLTTATRSGKEQLRYFANPGDSAASTLMQISGKSIRAWVAQTYETRIYQLDVGERRVIDYEVRRKQLTGDPNVLLIYFFMALGAFVLLSIKRYGEENQ